MNFKIKIFVLLFVLLALEGKTQNSGFYWTNLQKNSNRLQGKLTGQLTSFSAAQYKYHFFHADWYGGSIVLTDGDVFENMNLRYMSYNDQLIAFNETIRTLFIVDKNIVDTFYIDSDGLKQKFVRLYFDGLPEGNRYFEELYAGARSLLVFHYIKEIKTNPYKNEFGKMSDVEYEKDKHYFLYSASSGFKKIKLRRQSFYHTFPEHKKEIKRIFRKNRINLRSEWALIRALTELDKAGIL